MITRLIGLAALVVVILVGFSFVNRPEEGMYAKLVEAQVAQTIVPPTPASTVFPLVPTPTATATAVVSSPSPAGAAPTPTAAAATVGVGSTPFATGTAFVIAGTATPAPVTTTTGTAIPTPTFTPTPSATPFSEIIVGATGGQVSSPDGHVQISFPPGTTTEPLQIDISDKQLDQIQPLPIMESHRLNVWTFNAKAINRGYVAVHQFAQSFTLDLQYSDAEMFGLDGQHLHYWTFDDATSSWIESPVSELGDHHWTVSLNHFSTQATSADQTILLPPNLDAAEVSRNTGTISYGIPITVSPGLGGLQPNLALSYNSGVVDGSPAVDAASWAGAGWNLSMPSITRQIGSSSRYFINLNGVGDELIKTTTTQGSDDLWVTRHQSFLEVRHPTGATCDDATLRMDTTIHMQADVDAFVAAACSWTVRDQSGHTYVFGDAVGTASPSRRYYWAGNTDGTCGTNGCKLRDYQWDLSSATNTRNQQATYTYKQFFAGYTSYNAPWNHWVIASYPASITYPGGQVLFSNAGGETMLVPLKVTDDAGLTASVRSDAVSCYSGGASARVSEVRALTKIQAFSQTAAGPQYAQVREYDINGSRHTEGLPDSCASSRYRLDSVDVRGDNPDPARPPLQHYSFTYQQETSVPQNSDGATVSGPLATKYWLQTINNGLGGSVTFTLSATAGFLPQPVNPDTTHYSRFPVTQRVAHGGFDNNSNPDVTTIYTFNQWKPYYNADPRTTGSDVYRGFDRSWANTSGVQYVSESLTSNYVYLVDSSGTNAELAGRLSSVLRGYTYQNQTLTTYTYNTPAAVAGATGAFFDSLNMVTTALTTDTFAPAVIYTPPNPPPTVTSSISYTYNSSYGFVTSKTEDGDTSTVNNDDCRVTNFDDYTASPYFVVHRLVKVRKCNDASYSSDTLYGYDGTGGAPTSHADLTSTRSLADLTLLSATPYVYTLQTYDGATGVITAKSVPIYGTTTTPTVMAGRTEFQYSAPSGGRFPTSQTTYVYDNLGNALPAPGGAQTTLFSYNLTHGLPETVTTPDGVVRNTLYDEFGRVVKQWQLPDTQAAPTTELTYTWTGATSSPVGVNSTTVTHRGSAASTFSEVHCYDGLGRETQVNRPYYQGPVGYQRIQRVQTIYTTTGLVLNTRTFEPHAQDPVNGTLACEPALQGAVTGVPNHTRTYDSLGNLKKVVEDDGAGGHQSTVQSQLNGRSTFTYDQLNHRVEAKMDGLGRTVSSTTYTGATLGGTYPAYATSTMLYDALGDVTTMTENAGTAAQHSTVMTYDGLRREATMTDSDLSCCASPGRQAWAYSYDAAGNVLAQTDARSVTTSMTYDSANRVRQKSYSDLATAAVNFTYDVYDAALTPACAGSTTTAIGRLTRMTDGTGSTSWCYDSRGREARKHHEINKTAAGSFFGTDAFDVYETYDSANRPLTIKYPDSEILTYAYDDASGGKLKALTGTATYVSGTQYNHPTGALTELDLGGGTFGLKTNYTYDQLYRLQSIVSTKGASTPQSLTYDYWANGNIKNVNDVVTADNLFYNYDELNRLVDVRLGSPTGTPQATYTYGSGADLGKLTVMTEGSVTTTLAYGDADHPHAVTSRSGSPTAQPDSYTYDRDGNIAARTGGEKYTFDAENRLSTVASYPTQTNYWYDGLGNMDCRWTTTSPGLPAAADVRDRYLDGLYEEHSVFGQSQYTIKNYYAFGRIIAQRKTTTGTNPTSSVTYLLADHLGSTVGTVSDAGATEHMQYYPFGSVRAGHVSTDRGFTGQRREGFSRLGAYFYNARFYATGLGHFLSADTVSTDGLDRYAYGRFNPLRYNDPTGHGVDGCPPTRPDCPIDGKAPPTGGGGDGGCDADCQIMHALAAGCEANPGQGYCAGPGSGGSNEGGAAPPVPTPLCGTGAGNCPAPPADSGGSSGGCDWGPLCGLPGAAEAAARKILSQECQLHATCVLAKAVVTLLPHDCTHALSELGGHLYQLAPAVAFVAVIGATASVGGPEVAGGTMLLYTIDANGTLAFLTAVQVSQMPGVDMTQGFVGLATDLSDFRACAP